LPDELAGGTFTITNPGPKGNLFGTPIIHQPQVGILRLGQVVKRPVVAEAGGEESIVIRPMMYLALAYDHRIIDGVAGNGFLFRVRELLEQGEFSP
jgi:2-oxoglutarate dehydrogenase E2 component (dihydrolipoamide succinyltransferase)